MYLHGASISLDVNDITHDDLLLQDSFVYRRIETQLFRSFHRFQADHDMRDCFPITA